jgi:hypothetical protein
MSSPTSEANEGRLEKARQELEWRKCGESAEYFLRNYYFIPVVGIGAKLFSLRDYQLQTLNDLEANDFTVCLKARQIGMTTIVLGYSLWYALFHPNSPWLYISRNEKAAIKMLQRAKYAYVRLPKWMKDRVGTLISDTQSFLEFQNGSYLESIPSTGGTGRGDSVYGVVMDEGAYMDYADEIWAAVQPLVYGKAVVVSTANGMGNWFHDIWLDSGQGDSAWFRVFFPWDVVPSRDEKWYRSAWLLHRDKPWFFYQEYPSTADEAFAKSGRTAFSDDILKDHAWGEPVSFWRWDFDGNLVELDEDDGSEVVLRVWQEPELFRDGDGFLLQKPNFVIGVDVAEGLERGDATVLKVFDVNTGVEAAACSSHIPIEDLGEFIEAVGYWYFTALVVVERNSFGILPLDYLHKAHYPRLFRGKPPAQLQADKRREYGWVTSPKSKPKMVHDLAQALKTQEVLLNDEKFRVEAQTFVANGRGSYAATSGKADDNVMATCIAYQGYLQCHKYPIVWRDTKVTPLTFDDVFGLKEPKRRSLLDVPVGLAPSKVERSFLQFSPRNK